MSNKLNLNFNVAPGTDVGALAISFSDAFRQMLARTPVEAVVTDLLPGETLLCSGPSVRELPEAIHAVSQAFHAAKDACPDYGRSLFPHLKALVSELESRLVPGPVAPAVDQDLRGLFDQIGSRIKGGEGGQFLLLVSLLAELICVDGRYGVVAQRDLLTSMRAELGRLFQLPTADLQVKPSPPEPPLMRVGG